MNDSNLSPNLVELHQPNEEGLSSGLINEIGSLQFIVYDPVQQKDFSYDLSHPTYGSNDQIRRTLSELFIMRVSVGLGWSNPSIQSLSGRVGTVKNYLSSLRRLAVWWANNKPNSKLSEWDMSDVKSLLEDVLENKVDWQIDKNRDRYQAKLDGVANRGTLENIVICLNESEKAALIGKIQDGLIFRVSEKQQKTIVRPILKRHQLIYEDWKKGNSLPSIPLPVAMLLLNDAIEVVRDKKTAFLIEYFQFQRSDMYYSLNSIFLQDSFQRFCGGLWRFEGSGNGPSLDAKPKVEALLSLIHKYYGASFSSFPMAHNEINEWCFKVYQAALVILLLLTGARISELASMKAGSLTYNLDGVFDFKSDIIKTNNGISTVRAVHGLAAEAVHTLEELSYLDKLNQNEDIDVFLFGKFFSKKVKEKSFNIETRIQGASKETLFNMLKEFYVEFLERHPEIKAIWPNVHPHQFRHTFAEFALRRFDGNVHEAIRRHFRHSHGSFMTNIYLSNKVDEAFFSAQETMIQEIAEQMIRDARDLLNQNDTEPRFFGAAMKAALELLDATVISSEEELESVIEEFAEGFEKIVPHEYGYCMPRTKTISQSQCFDKVSKVAKLEDAGFSTCSSCVHSVQEINSHEASIVQIGLTHAHQMKSIEATTSFNLENNKQYQISMNAVKNAERVLKRMNSDKIIASSKE
ncbi:site-specific integrase [Marinomonas flavescens]|uniref:site-specific integrase n=1 Tax=Marinomonas flavescens TaxID=2529379 RepID=UPI0010556533|nr:site-specific integrase [Marinomonas flavescens]